ncbi:uncharacterized protein LOC116492437 isoform X2 [Aythya fuligula]|uniref:Uncharacterized protein LOC116492437 isoform X2 n=1 Tax=Aythya fuligula TaxID=219594 RepID=A0A6J3DC87_AYTFU|nr:uncharacterized protein LOC116492437 isoform X2 [Aythya fuligula]
MMRNIWCHHIVQNFMKCPCPEETSGSISAREQSQNAMKANHMLWFNGSGVRSLYSFHSWGRDGPLQGRIHERDLRIISNNAICLYTILLMPDVKPEQQFTVLKQRTSSLELEILDCRLQLVSHFLWLSITFSMIQTTNISHCFSTPAPGVEQWEAVLRNDTEALADQHKGKDGTQVASLPGTSEASQPFPRTPSRQALVPCASLQAPQDFSARHQPPTAPWDSSIPCHGTLPTLAVLGPISS